MAGIEGNYRSGTDAAKTAPLPYGEFGLAELLRDVRRRIARLNDSFLQQQSERILDPVQPIGLRVSFLLWQLIQVIPN